jgi:outer membrane lipoprotein-sorting protein
MKRLYWILIILLIIPVNTWSLTADQIIKISEDKLNARTQVSLMKMTIKTRRWTRVMVMKQWYHTKSKKSFAEIIAPKKDAGNRFLLMNKSMRHYIPKLARVIKISPSMMMQSWMGSDFSNDEVIKESDANTDFTKRLLGTKTVNGFKCYLVEMKPKQNAAVEWGKIVYSIRTDVLLPVKKEFYNQRGKLKKVMTFSAFKRMHGRLIPTIYRMQSVKKKKRYTELEIIKIRFNVRLPYRVFTIQNLKRR